MTETHHPGNEANVTLKLSVEHAKAVEKALDIYARLCLGQLNVIAEMVDEGIIPLRSEAGSPRKIADIEICERARSLMQSLKSAMGYHPGSSLGIGSPHVVREGHCAYEVNRTLARELALHDNPNPQFRGVNFDGLRLRYTDLPTPVAFVTPHHSAEGEAQ